MMLASRLTSSARLISNACDTFIRAHQQQRAFRSIYSRVFECFKDLVRPQPPKPPYKHACVIGDPVLRLPTQPLPLDDPSKAKEIVGLLKQVMGKYGAIGLAAPQVGVPISVFVMELPESLRKYFSEEIWKAREMRRIPFTAFVNPEMRILDNTLIRFPEGCESMKGYSAVVPRYYKVSVKAYDENLRPFEMEATGWTARVIQHEMDHLRGVLFTDRMEPKSLQYAKWHVVNCRKGRYKQKLYGKYL